MLCDHIFWLSRVLSLFFATVVLIAADSALAAAPDSNPTLRIETGGAHSAVIAGLTVSVDGKIVVTGSNDRTVRIWSMPGLRPLRTVFLPAWPYNNQGAAYTVALSPDSKTIIATGWTGSWEHEDGKRGPWCFYVIGVDKGDIQRTICDLPNWANHVAYSAKGNYIAFALKAGGGLRVYQTSDYSVAFYEPYPETSTWVEFDQNDRIATTCYDGKIRLYEKARLDDKVLFKMALSASLPEGRRPDSLSFSPDGSRIAVGYDEPQPGEPLWPAAIDIVSGNDLSVEPRPDLGGIGNGALWRATWSTDGAYLYATGSWRIGNRYPIRRWADGGKGKLRDFQGATSPNLRLHSMPSGGFVLTGEIPYLAVIGSEGVEAERQIPIADYTDIGDTLAVSPDGLSVQFAFEPSGQDAAYLSLARRALVKGTAPAAVEMSHRVLDAPNLDVRWSSSMGYRPTLNGEPLKMVRKYEQALSLTFTSDGKSFLLGTGWNLIRYDSKGTILWSTPVSFRTRGVVATKDGRLAVAAIGDGTIRWYAMDSGRELLAVLPHKDHRRWVAWTPSGFYLPSIDGDSLIGWTVNRGHESAAEFFEASHFRKTQLKPNIVLRTLADASETKAVQEARVGFNPRDKQTVQEFVGRNIINKLPPIVRIISPGDNSLVPQEQEEIEVGYCLRSPSGLPVSSVKLFIQGRPAPSEQAKGAAPSCAEQETPGNLKVKAPKLESFSLSIVAEAKDGRTQLESKEKLIHLRRSGIAIAVKPPVPTVYALIVGVGDYKMDQLKLTDDRLLNDKSSGSNRRSFPVRDAKNFEKQFKEQEGLAFKKVHTTVLTDATATAANIREGLYWLEQAKDVDDIALVYFSGHGKTDFLLPVDFDGRESATGIDKNAVMKALTKTNGRRIFFIDACQAAGGLFNEEELVSDAIKGYRNRITVVVSSSREQVSSGAAATNSYFTAALLEGLKGRAAIRPDSTEIRTPELHAYLSWRVPELSSNKQISGVYDPIGVPPLRLSVLKK